MNGITRILGSKWRRGRRVWGRMGLAVGITAAAGRVAIAHQQVSVGQNPIIQTKFTADPAPMVYKGEVYLYTGHDEDDATGFLMRNWQLYTSKDLVNWTDHGAVASLKDFKWADARISGWGGVENGAWAPQVIERKGKFYMYCPVQGRGIGVLVADNPMGPFTDPIGKPLIAPEYDSIDPTVFVDGDCQAYLYWGNPNLWHVKLKSDMISCADAPVKDPSFAKIPGKPDPFHYQEGPWIFKRQGRYYLAYASTCCPEGIGYATSATPTGPWQFGGYIVPPDGRSSGNHPGIIEYKGKAYVFGFNYTLNRAISNVHRERRSVCMAEMTFAADGSIPQLPWWDEGTPVRQMGHVNPYRRNEAETMSWTSGAKPADKWVPGVKTEPCAEGGINICRLREGGYVKVTGVDFGRGAGHFQARIASGGSGGTLEVRLDAPDGPLIGTCAVKPTGGWQTWVNQACNIRDARGVHDLYLVFRGEPDKDLFSLNWWKFATH